MLLIEKNVRVIFAQDKSFMILLFVRLAPLTLVSDEHFVLKDLSFYEVAHLTDVEMANPFRCLEEEASGRDFAPSP